MTRENKLSIVIAFGLLIFVGMLVADHYSIASHREVADLGSNVPSPPLLNAGKLIDGPPTPAPIKYHDNSSGDQVYTVQRGETLRSICSSHYGDSGLASAVANWNRMPNPNNLENGQTIALPTRASLFSIVPTPRNQVQRRNHTIPSNTPSVSTYTVKSGDTLSELAYKLMGTSKKTTELFNFNRDVMPDPDTIYPGMILQYPSNTN
jgi:nucleoid-associated protein YgaU